MDNPLHLYNTLTRNKEPLQTQQSDRVSMYVCGPTVYNYAHIGNARPAVVFDLLARLLRQQYSEVIYARNFTDVDDKINAVAAAAGAPINSITDRYIEAYHQDMRALSVLTPDIEPRVTEHIPAIIALIEKLLERGHAYCVEGHVLFHVPSYAEYGQLSGRQAEDMIAGARLEVAPYKRNPVDFVLWKPSTSDQPGWESPWGYGRPGWHVECSAMVGQHLGTSIDIHGGGQDLIFPHHENEIAQSTCANDGALYCHTWVHNSFVTVDGQKMSKSLGNVLLVRDLLSQAPGEAIRLALLSTHYRKPLDWNSQRLTSAYQFLRRFYTGLEQSRDTSVDAHATPDRRALAALNDDLNVSAALARLHHLLKKLKDAKTAAARRHAKGKLLASAGLLGLLQQTPAHALAELEQTAAASTPAFTPKQPSPALNVKYIEALLAERKQARQDRDFARADVLRQELSDAGVVVKDTPQGSTWAIAEEAEVC